MSGVARREAGDLEVVVHQTRRRRQRMIAAAEELFLVVVRRPPGQHRCEVQRFADDLRPHVFRLHAFGRVLVVRAAGGVDVMIAGEPAVLRRIDPARQLEDQLHRAVDDEALASVADTRARGVTVTVKSPGGSSIGLAVVPIDLRLEEEVGGEALRDVRIDAIERRRESGTRRSSGWPCSSCTRTRTDATVQRVNRNLDVVAEADVLRALADVEADERRPLPGVAAVDLQDDVFDPETRQPRPHRRLRVKIAMSAQRSRTCSSVSTFFGSGELPLGGT